MNTKSIEIDASKHPIARDMGITYKGKTIGKITSVLLTMVVDESVEYTSTEEEFLNKVNIILRGQENE